MSNEREPEIVDVEIVEIVEIDNVPAVLEIPALTHEQAEPITKWSEEWWAYQPLHTQARRCRAHSSRTGEPCKNMALLGGSTCRFHGGAAPHVKRAARARIENSADVMAKQLLGMALTAESESVKLTAIRDALDRAGLKPPAEVVLSQTETKPAFETVFDGISAVPLDECPDASSGYDSAGGDGEPLDQGDFSYPTQPSNPPTGHSNETATPCARENPGWLAGKDGDDSSDGMP